MLKALNEMDYTHDLAGRIYAKAGAFDSLVTWAPSWAKLEPQQGQIDKSQWVPFDTDVAAAHADGLKTFVACSSQCPSWAILRNGKGIASGRVPPDDLNPSEPWAKYIERVLLRHPHVQGIIVMNEPNLGFIEAPRRFIQDTAALIKTAATVWQRNHATPILLAPACADLPDGSGWASVKYFTEGVLMQLQGWKPPKGVQFGWAHHPYNDVREHRPTMNGKPLVQDVLNLLGKYKRERRIWLTEGGYEFQTELNPNYPGGYYWRETRLTQQEQEQLVGVQDFVRWCKKWHPILGKVEMFAQYLYQDTELSGGGWMSGLVRYDGTPRPLRAEWKSL
jgi:hypothetical protein